MRVIFWLVLIGIALEYWRVILAAVAVVMVVRVLAACYDAWQDELADQRDAPITPSCRACERGSTQPPPSPASRST